MFRLLTMLGLLIVAGAAPASAAPLGGHEPPIAAGGVNLPDPQHGCAEILRAAGKLYHVDRFPKDAETIGKLYTTAIHLNTTDQTWKNGEPDTFAYLTIPQLIQSYADLMGCFVSHRGALLAKPAPRPSGGP